MKKIAVVYSTKSGHTKTYADWLKEDVDADVISVDSFNTTKMLAYKLIIFACGVYGDKLPIMDYIKKNMSSIPADKIMIMAVSWYTNDSKEAAQKLIDENFPEQYKNVVPIYVLNSGIDKKKIPAMDKAKLIAAQMMIEKKDDRSSDDINALAIIKGYSDQTSRDNLNSIKNGIDEFFNPKKQEEPAAKPVAKPKPAPVQPAAAPKPEPVSEPSVPAPKPEPAAKQPAETDDLSDSVAAAFRNLGAPKPAPAAPVAESAPVQTADTDDLSDSVAAAFRNLGAPKPAPAAPAAEPAPVQTADTDDLSDSVAAAFRNLGAPKPAPAAPAAEPAPVQTADTDDLSDSVAAAFRNLGAPEPVVPQTPKAAEHHTDEPVVRFNSNGQVVVSSVLEAINSLNDTNAEPSVHASKAPDTEIHNKADAATEPKTASPATENEQSAAQGHKNSYMEMFASRRKKREEAALSSSENPAPAPSEISVSADKDNAAEAKPELSPVRSTTPDRNVADFDLDISETVSNASEFTFTSPSVSSGSEPAASAEIDLDGYDFIGEEQKPTASKRVLNAVQDLAKAKAEAEKEAARKAAELAAKKAAEQEAENNNSADNASSSPEPTAAESAFEKMKRDMEALAEESEHDTEYNEDQDMYAVTTFQDESDDEYNKSSDADEEIQGFVFEEPSEDGLDAFAFADTHDYYSGKTSTPEIARAEQPKTESNTELDLRKLQEQINASIEANKVNRERMQSKYGKRAKEAVNNPFAVQFDDDDSAKNKKNKKQQPASEPKRLSDPIDPDIFFSKPGKNKDFDMMSDTMPEIKFKH